MGKRNRGGKVEECLTAVYFASGNKNIANEVILSILRYIYKKKREEKQKNKKEKRKKGSAL